MTESAGAKICRRYLDQKRHGSKLKHLLLNLSMDSFEMTEPAPLLGISGAYSIYKSFVNAKAKRRQYRRTASEADKVHG